MDHLNSEKSELVNSLCCAKQSVLELSQQVNAFEILREELIQSHLNEMCESRERLNEVESANQHLTIALTNVNRELESSRAENDDLVSELNELRHSYADLVDREKLNESALESVYNELDKRNEVEREL